MSTPSPPRQGQATPTDESETVVLDACVVINLYATRHFTDILSDLPYRFAVAEKVSRDETLYVRRGGDGEDALEKEPIDVQPAVASGVLQVLSLTNEAEEAAFVSLAQVLDDGEAATGAIARHRGYSVATDDRTAKRSLGETNVRVYSTLELVREWCEMCGLTADEITSLLVDLRTRGSFVPPRGDPLKHWWDSHTSTDT